MKVRNAVQGWRVPYVSSLLCFLLCAAFATAAAEPVTEQAVRAAVESRVREAFAGRGETEVLCGRVPALGDLEGEELSLRAELLRDPMARGPVIVTVDFLRDGERIGRKAVSAEVRVWKNVAVAARRIGRHEVIDAASVRFDRVDLRALGDRPFAETERLTGLRARRMLPEGAAIVAGAVEAVPVVQRGDKVILMASVGGITVSASAVCQDDGAEGERVAVKNDRSGKRLTGVVMGQGLVWVDISALPGWGG
ncbi:MAG: flagellar basal body P-ring formation protein FlgA [Candidatus Eisenbacteria bacterium]|nr:flagellar basal body P-ring formation protein FlgA [Candidatus Eisenbacteria bacterium]